MVHPPRRGVADPKAAFGELRAFRNQLLAMQNQVRPFGPDYLILSAVGQTLDTAA
jgi:hypothetical protein